MTRAWMTGLGVALGSVFGPAALPSQDPAAEPTPGAPPFRVEYAGARLVGPDRGFGLSFGAEAAGWEIAIAVHDPQRFVIAIGDVSAAEGATELRPGRSESVIGVDRRRAVVHVAPMELAAGADTIDCIGSVRVRASERSARYRSDVAKAVEGSQWVVGPLTLRWFEGEGRRVTLDVEGDAELLRRVTFLDGEGDVIPSEALGGVATAAARSEPSRRAFLLERLPDSLAIWVDVWDQPQWHRIPFEFSVAVPDALPESCIGVRTIPRSLEEPLPFEADGTGLTVALAVAVGERFVASIDGVPQPQPWFETDAGNPVRGGIGSGRLGEGRGGVAYLSASEIDGSRVRSVHAAGRLAVRASTGSGTVRSVVWPVEKGARFDLGDFEFEVSRVEDRALVLRTGTQLWPFRAYRFVDADGRSVPSEFRGATGARSANQPLTMWVTFDMDGMPERMAMEVDVWEGVELVEQPFDFELRLPGLR